MLKKLLCAVAALALLALPAHAQVSRAFVPDSAATTTIACSNVNATAALPGTGAIIAIQNTGQIEVFVALGPSTVVAAVASAGTATNGTPILPGTAAFLSALPQANTIACITATGTTNIRVTTGAGNPVALAGVNAIVQTQNPLPFGATAVTGSGTGTTGAVTATLAGAVGKTTYICGFSVSPGSATTAIVLTETVATLIGGNTFTWSVGAPATAAGVTGATLTVPFSPCMPTTAQNTAITVTSSALGTGGAGNDVNAWGFQQ